MIASLFAAYPAEQAAMSAYVTSHGGNQYLQAVLRALPAARATGTQQSLHVVELVRSRLFPAYRAAIDALDPLAALELARHIVHAISAADHERRAMDHTLVLNREDASVAVLDAQLSTVKQLEIQLSMQIGPQFFRGKPVTSLTMPKVGGDYVSFLVAESSRAIDLVAIASQVRDLVGPGKVVTPEHRQKAAELVERSRSRPVDFEFLAHVLETEHAWQPIASEEVFFGDAMNASTLSETRKQVRAQAAATGELTDVGDLDLSTLQGLLDDLTASDDLGERPDSRADRARAIMDKLGQVPPTSRGAIVRQIHRSGALDELFRYVPKVELQRLHDSIRSDPDAQVLMNPYLMLGEGRSLHRRYMDEADERTKAGRPDQAIQVRAFDYLHNLLSLGFLHDYSDAYDAREQGLITDDEFHDKAINALEKAGLVSLAAALSGGVADKFVEGFATAIGAGKTTAELVASGVGGAVSGVGGHLTGDVYDQAVNGKQGFDSASSYLASAGIGAALGGISVGAGKYLGIKRPIDVIAERHPALQPILEKLRAAGLATGDGATNVAIAIELRASEARALIEAGVAHVSPKFATAGADIAALPDDALVKLALRQKPMQASRVDDDGFELDDHPQFGSSPTVRGMREVKGSRAIGAEANPKHHVYPQEHRTFFEERGFTGANDIDNFCVVLEKSQHQAIHGGGNYRLGRTWPGEWNTMIIARLRDAEAQVGRRLTFNETKLMVERVMSEYDIEATYVPYR